MNLSKIDPLTSRPNKLDIVPTMRPPWWIHPLPAIAFVSGATALYAVTRSDDAYRTWGTARHLSGDSLVQIAIGLMSLILGATIGLSLSKSAGDDDGPLPDSAALVRLYVVFFRLTLLGYTLWLLLALLRGLDVATVTGVITLQPGAISTLKSIAAPVGGVTTITQFGPAAVALAVLLRMRYQIIVRLAPIVILAVGRAFFYAERLALLEVVLAGVVTAALLYSPQRLGPRARRAFSAAPILAIAGLWATFGAFEYSRSWTTYRETTNSPYAMWITDRLLSYYATSYNNSALLASHLEESTASPYFSMLGFWEFPGVRSIISAPAHGDMDSAGWWQAMLAQYANPEFTSPGSFLVVQAEWGLLGAVAYWGLIGLAFGMLYAQARKGYVWATIGYAVSFIGLLELPRLIYFAEGRFLPMIIAVAMVANTERKGRHK